MLHTKVDKKIRDSAKKVAQSLGIPLSLVVEQALRDFTVSQRVVVYKPLVPTPYLEKILREVDKDIRTGNKKAFSPTFTNTKDMDDYLDAYVETCK